ncbi:MAG: SLC13 family permease [Porticoccaceae bacterium]|jgi:sodium-dependent dicarboxylate transporter 2/3/5|nr:SLC13 family permease [Porticoccaceae bacterium]
MSKSIVNGAIMAAGIAAITLGVEAEGQVVTALALLWVIAYLWISEAFHITITALLIPLLAVATGLLDVKGALANFAHPIIFLFLGGFALAAAMHIQGLDRWLADSILRLTGGRLDRGVLLLALATALLSMWISNTAVTAMMLPLVLGLLSEKPDLPYATRAFSLLAIAYSASIGGVGTLIGTPPNAIVAAELGLSFVDWLYIGVPLVVVLWPLMMVVLARVLRPDFQDARLEVRVEAFAWTRERRVLLGIFTITVIGWLFGRPLSALLGVGDDMDTWVALLALGLIAATGVARWQQIEKSTDWGVLLLFGGGLTLNGLLKSSGASEFLGLGLAGLIEGWGVVLVIMALVTFVVFFSEVTSNTATAALLVPLFVALPGDMLDPTQAALAIGVAASTAFMLPVGTPPNALVHGTGMVRQQTMIRAGFVLNLVCIAVLTLVFSQFYGSP